MGFSFHYESTEPVSPDVQDDIQRVCREQTDRFGWAASEPIWFHEGPNSDLLFGSSKVVFEPDPAEVLEAEEQGLGIGTIRDVIDILCLLSKQFGITWEVGHDHSEGPLGVIKEGEADAEILMQADALTEAGLAVAGLGGIDDEIDPSEFNDEDFDDDEPPILKLFSDE